MKLKYNQRLNCVKYIVFCILGVGIFRFGVHEAKADTNTVDFLYDGGGQRIYKGINGGGHTYYVSPDLEITVASDGTTTWRRNYSYNGRLVAVRESSGVNFIHQDHLGSTNIMTDSAGEVIGQQSYFPYGSTRNLTGMLTTERQYTGQVSDQEITGLYYYNARYYNPVIGKFTQADAFNAQLNRYAYVGNKPINNTDPTGNWGEDIDDEEYLEYIAQNAQKNTVVSDVFVQLRSESTRRAGVLISPHPYIAQQTTNSCGSAVIAMYLATISDNYQAELLYPYIFKEINYGRYTLPWYIDNYKQLREGLREELIGPGGIEDFVEDYFDYRVKMGAVPNRLLGNKSLDELLRREGSIIVDIDVGYSPIERGYANHWVIIDEILEIDNVQYVRIRDPYRSKDPDAFRTPLEYMKASGTNLLVPWNKFKKTIGGYWISFGEKYERMKWPQWKVQLLDIPI